jgi:Zn-dependent protease
MFRSLRLGTAFGIGIFVHWTFPLLLVLVAYLSQEGGPQGIWFSVALVLLVFGCIILHELGHALMARHYGIKTRDITIFPIGGVARLERMSEKPWEEFMIAIAGPAVNVVIALLLGLGLFALVKDPLASVPAELENVSEVIHQFGFATPLLTTLMLTNVGLVIFNMIPAFPMDGGRVLRALLASLLGHLPATEIAAGLGVVLALALAVLGMFRMGQTHNPMLIVVSMFVLLAGQQELAAVRQREARRNAPPLDILPASGLVQVTAAPPEPEFSGFTFDRQLNAWIEWRDGRAVHICRIVHPGHMYHPH